MYKYLYFFIACMSIFQLNAQQFSTNSKLSNGTWYKISINEDGIYKLDYNFINSNLNINPQNLSFSNFGVFGQGMGLLPERNDAFRVDDILEIGIHVNDANNNGKWDPADYILFYGKGPDIFTFNEVTQDWGHIKNPYSDISSYFITIDNGTGKAIETIATQNISGSALTRYDYFDYFEEEINNLVYTEYRSTMGSGREWYGKVLNNISPNQNINFNVPNIVSSIPVTIKTKLAAKSNNSTSFNVKANGSNLFSQFINGISNSSNYPPVGISNKQTNTFTSNSTINLEISYNSSNSQDKGWIDYVEILAKANLNLSNNALFFRELSTFGETSKFRISNALANTQIWDITRGYDVKNILGNLSNGQFEFSTPTDTMLQYFVAVNVNSPQFPVPEYIGTVRNQNIHAISNVDLVIVTNNELLQAAERLAGFRRSNDGLNVSVVLVEEIYNEFSSGQQDLTAIRDFFRMLYKKGQDNNYPFRYALMFGDASFDFKNRIPGNEIQNIVPSYQSYESLDILRTFVTDDFFGFLDDNEGENLILDQGDIDIAIGRFPISTIEEANGLVDKIIHYTSRSSFGDWRNDLTFVADDEDNNLHKSDAEKLTNLNFDRKDYYNIDKIYLDAFQQANSSGGDRYPQVNESILRKLFKGTFLMNYSGHGGPENWAQERVFNISDIRNLDNIDNLPLFITATCDFAPYDDPAFHSAGESLLTNERGGAIALITTTRLVFASANLELNRAVLNNLFKEYEGRMPTIGEVMKFAKNDIFGGENNRKFILLGDPSMTLAYPKHEVITTHINDELIDDLNLDTLKALSRVKIKGQIIDKNQNILSDFNGVVFPSVYDKPRVLRTRGNDAGSSEADFEIQNSLLFKGAASVRNGEFEFEFIVPKDINYSFDNGKLSYYALSNETEIDAHGYSRDFLVGGTADNFEEDFDGPSVELFINDTNFVFGGISHENPLLIAKLEDESGINTVGNGIGHDITAVLNGNTQNQYLLNDFYEAALDDFTRGEVRFPFNRLEDGKYTLEVKAWDVHNNSGTGYTEFTVVSSEKLALESVLNYPNPFGAETNFIFEHNMPGEQINVTIEIFNYNGQKVKTLTNTILSEGTRLSGGKITWDGTSNFGTPLANGVYLYKLIIQNEQGLTAQEFEKLMILK